MNTQAVIYETTTTTTELIYGMVYTKYRDRSNYVLRYEGLEGIWHGVYNCSQGDTNLILQVGPEDIFKGYAKAVFMFYPTDYNPDVKSGSFRMTGKRGGYGKDGMFHFEPSSWIIRPSGYSRVGLTVHETTSNWSEVLEMRGTVDKPGCSVFNLYRL
ncbi:MAG: hypothetical protein OXE99_05030 [Cellvibrionales bacterium]|nr:hypothetical protein [Cellvibrionales bacterium]